MLNAKQQKALKALTLIRPCPDIYRQGVRDFGLSFPFVPAKAGSSLRFYFLLLSFVFYLLLKSIFVEQL
jgi:hypothetical protein